MEDQGERIKMIPREILCIIPMYDGDEKLLNLFLAKCEYVIRAFHLEGNVSQNLYVFHSVTSRLTGRAATLLSEHQHLTSWIELKEILTQHFGDPRSEECIAIEMESVKIKQGESYSQLCKRIQNVRSSLFAKVNRITDEGIKAAKMIIYNNTALNVFLYNLSEDMIRIVRLKGCSSLEHALNIVTEEVNFLQLYSAKKPKPNAVLQSNPQNAFRPLNDVRPSFSLTPNQHNFKFGIPQNQSPSGFRPNFIQSNRSAPPQGYRLGAQPNMPQRNFNQGPTSQFRPPFQQGGFRFGVPQQQFKFGIPNQQLPNNNQFKFGVQPQNQQYTKPRFDTDVSMRTAPVRQNMISDDLFYSEDSPPYQDYYHDSYDNNCYELAPIDYVENPHANYDLQENPEEVVTEENSASGNFQTPACNNVVK